MNIQQAKQFLFQEHVVPHLNVTEHQARLAIEHLSDEVLVSRTREQLVQAVLDRWKQNNVVVHRDRAVSSIQKPVQPYEVHISVPFSGNARFFGLRADAFGGPSVSAWIRGDQLIFDYTGDNHHQINSAHKRDLDCIEGELGRVQDKFDVFNSTLREKLEVTYAARLALHDKLQGFMQGLAVPLAKKAEPLVDFPAIKQRIIPELPTPGSPREPALLAQHYDHIIKIFSDLGRAMELSPKVFARQDEEDLRTLFLVLLNGHYEGAATAETFNLEGKTDILLKHMGGNVFIAEFKKWSGEAGYLKAIDQLLGYVSYNDTKTALVVFVDRAGFTDVVLKMHDATVKHPNFHKESTQDSLKAPTRRYEFKNKNDAQKLFEITTLPIFIPSKSVVDGSS
jgi:hypothetical protein